MQNLNAFIEENSVRLACEWATSRPDNLMHGMDHWKCVMRAGKSQYTFYFSKGYGHKGAKPTIEEILECFADDYFGFVEDFDDFCDEYGYDSDSREAERIHRGTAKQAAALDRLFGESGMADLNDAINGDN